MPFGAINSAATGTVMTPMRQTSPTSKSRRDGEAEANVTILSTDRRGCDDRQGGQK